MTDTGCTLMPDPSRHILSLEERVAVLENKVINVAEDVKAIREAIEKMSGDVSNLTQITALGKLVWRFLLWAGAAVSGIVAVIYMVLQIKGSLTAMPVQDLPHHVLQHAQPSVPTE